LVYLYSGYWCRSQGQRWWFKGTSRGLIFTGTYITTRRPKEFPGSWSWPLKHQ
jgi:hypothetical protein